MSANKPLVSIVVPTYKRADRIRVALDSIAAQDYGAENIDLIVVSDNRPEWPESAETDAAVAPYAVSLPHFRLLHTAGQTGGGGGAQLRLPPGDGRVPRVPRRRRRVPARQGVDPGRLHAGKLPRHELAGCLVV